MQLRFSLRGSRGGRPFLWRFAGLLGGVGGLALGEGKTHVLDGMFTNEAWVFCDSAISMQLSFDEMKEEKRRQSHGPKNHSLPIYQANVLGRSLSFHGRMD